MRRRRGKQSANGRAGRREQGIDRQDLAEPVALQRRDRQGFHEHRPRRRRAGDQPGMKRVEPEAQLKQERQQKRRRAHAHAEQAAADDTGADGRELQQFQVDQRIGDAPGMPGIGHERQRAEHDAAGGDSAGQQVPAERRQAEHQHREPDTQQRKAERIERRQFGFADIRDVAKHQEEPEYADRHVDQEDAAPVEVLGDEPAQRRPHDRAQQRGYGEVVERLDQPALGHGLQQHQPAHRHHHRAAYPLHEACEHERGERARACAQQRSAHEHHDGGGKDGARAVAVGHPSADRNEYRKADQIGGKRQFERERILANIARDRRQRSGQHRGIHVFHEQRAGDDQGDQDLALHRADGPCAVLVRMASTIEAGAYTAGPAGGDRMLSKARTSITLRASVCRDKAIR